jgi:hypothetical protein
MTEHPHAPDCACNKTLHRFKCRHCKRVVGWCMGAHDAVERRSGPICDDCVYQISIADGSMLDLAAVLEQMEQTDPAVRAAAAHYHATVKKILRPPNPRANGEEASE